MGRAPGWVPVGKFIFNKYHKDCQSELKKKDDVTHFRKNDKVRLKKHCFL